MESLRVLDLHGVRAEGAPLVSTPRATYVHARRARPNKDRPRSPIDAAVRFGRHGSPARRLLLERTQRRLRTNVPSRSAARLARGHRL